MKILVYTTLFPNHMQPNHGIFIKQRMLHFARMNGCCIKVVAPVPYSPPYPKLEKYHLYSQIIKSEIMDGIEIYHPRYPLIPKVSMLIHGFSLFLSSLNFIKRIHRDFPFDLIDGHYIYPDGLAAVLLGKALKKPVVLSARGSDINQFTDFRTIKPMIKYALLNADHVISVCDALKNEMLKFGLNPKRISVVPNGVDTELFYPVGKKEARKKLSIPFNHKVILSVGSLIPRKGFDLLLAVARKIVSYRKDLKIYIVGEGPLRGYLQNRIAHWNLSNFVKLVGEVPHGELKFWYSAADVFCLSSSREGWANVIMESLACGCPVVATNVWGAPEIIKSSDIGVLVDRNTESLFSGLFKALGKKWDRKLIRTHVKDHDWFSVAEEVKAIFESVLNYPFIPIDKD